LEFQVSLQGIEKVDSPSKSEIEPQISLRGSIDLHPAVLSKEAGENIKADSVVADQVVEKDVDTSRKVKVTVVSGQVFEIIKKRFRKDDIPDLYCTLKFGSNPNEWRTGTIKDSMNPEWNESKIYTFANDQSQVISLNVWDANKTSNDTLVGSLRVALGKVLVNFGEMELELEKEGAGIGAFLTVACKLE